MGDSKFSLEALAEAIINAGRKKENSEEDTRAVSRDAHSRLDLETKRGEAFNRKLNKAPTSDYRKISVSPSLISVLGPTMIVGVNGNIIYLPVNGKEYMVHKAHYNVARDTIRVHEEKILRLYNKEADRFFQDSGDYSEVRR